jgi:hypothetical protein
MSYQYYNRYVDFEVNGGQTIVPFVPLRPKNSDQRYIYRVGRSRMDKISQEYYGTPFFGWLILQSNPQFGGLEWSIPDGTTINVPFPLVATLQDYNAALNNYFFYYGR